MRKYDRKLQFFLPAILLFLLSPLVPAAENPLGVQTPAPFAAKFSDGRLTLDLAPAGGAYAGTITFNGKTYPAQAKATGDQLQGTFDVAAEHYPFTATLKGDALTFISAGVTYNLVKAQPANPLAANAAAAQDRSGDFLVLATTASGRTLFLQLPNPRTAETAITGTADALAKIFDAKPNLSGAFADSKNKQRGGALFTAKIAQRDIRGWIFFSIGDKTTDASVAYASDKAPQTEIETLFAALPAQAKMKEHPFPDGSGSVDLPPDWTTPTQSLAAPLIIKGPADQGISSGLILSIVTPDGQLMKLANQNYQMKLDNYKRMSAMSARLHSPPPPAPGLPPDPERDFPNLIFCRYCPTPEEAMQDLIPILLERQKKQGGPEIKIDKVVESTPVDPTPGIANAKASVFYWQYTRIQANSTVHFRAVTRLECYPVFDGKDTWTINLQEIRAPQDAFDRDFQLMNDILKSVKVDQKWLMEKMKQDGERLRRQAQAFSQQMFQQSQQFQAQQKEHFERFESQMRAQAQARHDSNSDFIEMIRGVRTVYDTKTGERADASLYHVDGIVQGMNDAANDPGRFIQIPLRYER